MKTTLSIASACRLLCAISLILPPLAGAQGILLRPGNVINFEFTTMTLASSPVRHREHHGYEGILVSSKPFIALLRVDLFEPGQSTPTAAIPHEFTLQSWQGPSSSFGFAEWGTPWQQQRGAVRLTYLSGPEVQLASFSAHQTLASAGVLTAYEAILPIPEASTPALLLLGGVGLLCAVRFHRRTP
jgi:hypothetical protein